MATFTSVPQATSSQFRHYNPMSLKRTKSKAKVTGYALGRDRTEGETYNSELLHQDTGHELHTIPQQIPQVQETGHIADHGINMYDLPSDDSRYQSGRELLDKGVMDYATRVATSDSATNGLLDGSSIDFHSIEESGTAEEHHSATHFQHSNRAYPVALAAAAAAAAAVAPVPLVGEACSQATEPKAQTLHFPAPHTPSPSSPSLPKRPPSSSSSPPPGKGSRPL
ncbi:hypothetical protein EJ02DRAFT_426203 [Clathrospora elynae]|uniref:Uncharacterized protein n=1 Tax=Clathrospora elynae TaxID=706981 RepID=A0A6A5SEA8_9PLEO|nr:hypothetical protein EJ02DRAFT_426203 [Clathrospora elynae]